MEQGVEAINRNMSLRDAGQPIWFSLNDTLELMQLQSSLARLMIHANFK